MAVYPRSIALATPPQQPCVSKAVVAGMSRSSSMDNLSSMSSKLTTKQPKRATSGGGLRRSRSSDSIFSETPLPDDVQQLKERILETHPEKLTRFSLSHMRRVAIPPVEIPKSLKSRSAVSTVVSGKSVPLTKQMWENRKKRTHHLDMIDEYVLYK